MTKLYTLKKKLAMLMAACMILATIDTSAAADLSRNLASGIAPTCSGYFTNGQRLTDGDKNSKNYVDIASGVQWVQLDLGSTNSLEEIRLWHYYNDARKYRDVVVQLSNDKAFASGVTTVFNNDSDNTSGLGAGKDAEYAETSGGKKITFSPVSARYVRFYTNGSTVNKWNHYVEAEVYGSESEPTPPSLSNLASGIAPTCSGYFTNGQRLTDGDKNSKNYVDITSGVQWVQLDLGSQQDVSEIRLWHYYYDARKYRDVVVQLSNDKAFASGVTTVFNNDSDNTSGLGAGKDAEYAETSGGKKITFSPVSARYVRFYSNGSTVNTWSHYVEAEVYGSESEPTPPSLSNLASGIAPTCSGYFTNGQRLTDGDKNSRNYVDVASGVQWMQLDLGSQQDVSEIRLWHYYYDARKYRDVVVQLSNDKAFASGVTTVFNNDSDNTSGLGVGKDAEYAETSGGKKITFSPVSARYVRFYSNGSTVNTWSHYVEAEVYDGETAEPDIAAIFKEGIDPMPTIKQRLKEAIIASGQIPSSRIADIAYWSYPASLTGSGIKIESDGLSVPFENPEQGRQNLKIPFSRLVNVLSEDFVYGLRDQTLIGMIESGNSGGKRIALTFDDGPNALETVQALDILKSHGARATFYFQGKTIGANQELVRRALAEGNEVGNHSWDHPYFSKLTDRQIHQQILGTEMAVYQATGKFTFSFRPPYGDIDQRTASASGVPVVLWSLNTKDWETMDPEAILSRIKLYAADGDIILAHEENQATLESLDEMIAFLRSEGYEFVTVSELYGYDMHPYSIYSSENGINSTK